MEQRRSGGQIFVPVSQPENANSARHTETVPAESLLERVQFNGDPDLINNFVCQVCQDLLRDPQECSKCRNVFCRVCIDRWQRNCGASSVLNLNSLQCPLRCRGVQFLKISIPFKYQLENLFKLKCVNNRSGCTEEVCYGRLNEHEKTCGFEMIMCLNPGCEAWIARQEMAGHRKECLCGIEVCEYCIKEVIRMRMKDHLEHDCQLVLLECHLCKLSMPRRQFIKHEERECAEVSIKCEHYPQCQVMVLRKNLAKHLQRDCFYQEIQCDKVCRLPLPRVILDQHDCATELRRVLDCVLVESDSNKRERQQLVDENSRLLQLVENTAEKIENMEALIEAQKRQIMMSNPSLNLGNDDSNFQSRQLRAQLQQERRMVNLAGRRTSPTSLMLVSRLTESDYLHEESKAQNVSPEISTALRQAGFRPTELSMQQQTDQMPHTNDRLIHSQRRQTAQNSVNQCPAELSVELEVASRMLIQGETIDLICWLKSSNHLAMANRQGPVQIYAALDFSQQVQRVTVLDEDHTRFISGICEITKIKVPVASSHQSQSSRTDQTGALIERVDERSQPTQSQLVTCGLDGKVAIYDIVQVAPTEASLASPTQRHSQAAQEAVGDSALQDASTGEAALLQAAPGNSTLLQPQLIVDHQHDETARVAREDQKKSIKIKSQGGSEGPAKKKAGAFSRMFSCFASRPKQQTKDNNQECGEDKPLGDKQGHQSRVQVEMPQPKYKYVKVCVVSTHDSEINCIEALPFQSYLHVNFATGARNEIKLWNSGRCMHTIPNAHQSQIYSIRAFLTLEQHLQQQIDFFLRAGRSGTNSAPGSQVLEAPERQPSVMQATAMIFTGGRDKSLKLWRLKRRQDGEIRRTQINGQNSSLIQADLIGFTPNLSQINCMLQLSPDKVMAGFNCGKIRAWQVTQNTFSNLHQSKPFSESCTAMEALHGYDYLRHPYVAIVGIVSRLVIFNVSDFTEVKSIRVLVSNWHTFRGVSALPQNRLIVGALDGSAKVYKLASPHAHSRAEQEENRRLSLPAPVTSATASPAPIQGDNRV